MYQTQNVDKEILRIGVFVRDIDKLDNWEYRILNEILKLPNLELAVIVLDGRKQGNITSWQNNEIKQTASFLTRTLFALQSRIESLKYREKPSEDVDYVISNAKQVESIYSIPVKKGASYCFSIEDCERIRAYSLDILLNLGFGLVYGDGLDVTRHGIWSLHFADYETNRSLPIGFWENLNKEECCCLTLLQTGNVTDGVLIIDKALYKPGVSFVHNKTDLMENSSSLLFKSLNLVLHKRTIKTAKPMVYFNRLQRFNFFSLLKYTALFYPKILTRIRDRLPIFKHRAHWALFYGKGEFLETELYKATQLQMPKKREYWADPFLYRYKGQLYVFFEVYQYKTKRGKISCGKIVDNGNGFYSITDVKDVLNFDYHLSYPQVIYEDGEIYLMPETCANDRLEVYLCTSFPDKWEPYSVAFAGKKVIDANYYVDLKGDRWIFLNIGRGTQCVELQIFKIDSLKFNSIIQHGLNPVLLDCRSARSGGAIFEYEGEHYRPSQEGSRGAYGKALHISKIKKLTLDEFEVELAVTVKPGFRKGLIGIHHLHKLEDEFVVDAYYAKI